MALQKAAITGERILVGTPLPFSVYSSDRKLLLSEGHIVESDRQRDYLIRAGVYVSGAEGADGNRTRNSSVDEPPVHIAENPLNEYVREYQSSNGQPRVPIRMAREESGESYPAWILGADEQQGLIVTAPATGNGSMVAVSEGQTWIFRTLYLTAAVKFHSSIRKVQFEPTPCLHVATPSQVELRHVRSSPRASTCVHGTFHVGKDIPVLIIEVSSSGLAVAVERDQYDPKAGQRLIVSFTINLLDHDYTFKVPATVAGKKHEYDKRYPLLWVCGLSIEAQSELERVVLHGYVHQRLNMELNPLWRTLVRK